MRYSVEIRRRAVREIERIPALDRRRVVGAIRRLAEDTLIGGVLTGELRGLRRLRVGNWRVLYEVDDEASVVLIVRAALRRDAYRRRAR